MRHADTWPRKRMTIAVAIVTRSHGEPGTTKSLRLRVCAKVAQRPVDFMAILAAVVASIVIIVNAVFFAIGSHVYEPEQLSSKLQKPQETLKSEAERLQHKIDSALAGIKIMETRSDSRRAH
jgi:hypothetical protein